MLDKIQMQMFEELTDLHEVPQGAYNIRLNGKAEGRRSSENIEIVPKTDKPGIDIIIKPGTKHESVHIPVILSQTGLTDLVYNDFYIGEDADVVIVAGCGIHNGGDKKSEHDGIHSFHVAKNGKLKYIEKHLGVGEGTGERVLNPTTIIELAEGAYMEMETTQIKGVDSTIRVTSGKIADNATLIVNEKIMTHGKQEATTDFTIDMDGDNCKCHLTSRSVAKGESKQTFKSRLNGNNRCTGHSECDAILMDKGSVTALPALTANNLDAALIHEAAIGKIAGEQIIKLMTLGLTEKEAEDEIVNGFLR